MSIREPWPLGYGPAGTNPNDTGLNQPCAHLQPQPTPMGCICPPGANLTCAAPTCPRKPINMEVV
jgi:hypothetical protein